MAHEHSPPFVDIHCHLVPSIDDGAKTWDESLEMARMAVADGIQTIVVTPHQLGNYSHNTGQSIRERTAELQQFLNENQVPLQVLPGADVRIEPEMIRLLRTGDVLSLADRRRHVLLELPHEMYIPLEGLLDQLATLGMVGILSHPERNQGILKQPTVVEGLVERGCMMQVTAGSLLGGMGAICQQVSEWMLQRNLVHFLATDAHGPKARRPLLRRAFERAAELTDITTARAICCENPAAVAAGRDVNIPAPKAVPRRSISSWFSWRKAA